MHIHPVGEPLHQQIYVKYSALPCCVVFVGICHRPPPQGRQALPVCFATAADAGEAKSTELLRAIGPQRMAAMMSTIGLPGATQAVSTMGHQKAAAATITQMGPANGAAMFKQLGPEFSGTLLLQLGSLFLPRCCRYQATWLLLS
jgi:hypothetical protein